MLLGLAAVLVYALTRPEDAEVPRVEGRSLVQARAVLEKQGFDKIEVERVRSSFPLDQVLDQDPDPGESVSKDDTVTLEVSDGPGTVNVPSVRNLPLERAAKELTKAGLKFNVDEEPSSAIRQGFAVRTSPREGQEVERGSRVRLFVSSGPRARGGA